MKNNRQDMVFMKNIQCEGADVTNSIGPKFLLFFDLKYIIYNMFFIIVEIKKSNQRFLIYFIFYKTTYSWLILHEIKKKKK